MKNSSDFLSWTWRLLVRGSLCCFLFIITAREAKVMFSVCLLTGPSPQVKVRSRSRGPQGQGLGGPQVKVQVKVQGAPRSRSGSRSGVGPQVQVKVQGPPPRSRSAPPQVKVQKGRGCGRYASCGHAGGLSCSWDLFRTWLRKGLKLSE